MNTSVNKTTAINILSAFMLQGLAFWTTPIFTNMLGTSQFGIYSIFNAWIGVFTCVMGLGVTSTLATGRYTFIKDYLSFKSCILLLSTIISVSIIIIIWIFRDFWANAMNIPVMVLLALLSTSFSRSIVSYVQSGYVYEKKPINNLMLSLGIAISTVVLSIVLIKRQEPNCLYIGRVYGVAIPYCLFAIVLWISLFGRHPSKLVSKYCKFGFSVGFPIVFHMLSHNILTQSDRIMMNVMGVSESEIGIYSLFYTISTVLSVILNAFNTSFCPFYYDGLASNNIEDINKKCKNYIELFTVLVVGFLLVVREVSFIMSSREFMTGVNIVPFLAFAVYFTFMYQFPTNYEFFYKKTKIIAVGTMCAGLINIVLNYLLIPLYGIYGAALATVVSYVFLYIVHYVVVMKMTNGTYHLMFNKFLPCLILISLAVGVFYIAEALPIVRWILAIAIGAYELIRLVKRRTFF